MEKKDFDWMKSNFDDIRERDFPNIKKKIYDIPTEETTHGKKGALTDKVFIVHGRNHKPMKELKVMLQDFGLNPIVLHEQPSGSRTIVEKLEKYSDVGYAFAILTPDDVTLTTDILNMVGSLESAVKKTEHDRVTGEIWNRGLKRAFIELSKKRARQNVILEFGYFMGLLGRDRVCCLYRGDVELPSDMQGIVYIPFKESINEVRGKIIKELEAAGYKIADA